MATSVNPTGGPAAAPRTAVANGAAMAAFLAAGAGTFLMGLFVILNEAGVYTAPSLYGPAGGVSGRTTFGAVAWLIVWGTLHARWKERSVDASRVLGLTLALIALGLVMMFPPVWGLVSGE
jgi:hypothetical protein